MSLNSTDGLQPSIGFKKLGRYLTHSELKDENKPTLVGERSCKRNAGGTVFLLHDGLINVSLALRGSVGDLSRVVLPLASELMIDKTRSKKPIVTSITQCSTRRIVPKTGYGVSVLTVITRITGSTDWSRDIAITPCIILTGDSMIPAVGDYQLGVGSNSNTLSPRSMIRHTESYLSYYWCSNTVEVAA